MKKSTYRTVAVQSVDVLTLLSVIAGRVVLALDIAKEAMVFAVADSAGKTHALVRFSHPKETSVFLHLAARFRELGREVHAVMEPTGLYGEALRHQLTLRDFAVYRVDPKRCHDFRAVLDGVSSQHDAKSCTLIAALHAQGISSPWRQRSDTEEEARALVDEHRLYAEPLEVLYGRMEAITAAAWPELNEMMEQRTSWHLRLMSKYPCAADVARHRDEARAVLQHGGRGGLRRERIERVLDTAATTLGVPMSPGRRIVVQRSAERMLVLRKDVESVEKRLRELCASDTALGRLAAVVGPVAATALFAEVGDPAQYASAGALEKACGLNLREASSGKHKGKLHITKRGSSRVRHYLYLAALRLILSSSTARGWYERRSAHAAGHEMKAVVALMRKLVRALFHVARGAPFQVEKLFDLRRLDNTSRAA